LKILFDSAFSSTVEDFGRPGMELHRWSGSDVSDLELIAQAGRDGYRGVVFLGQQVLARPGARDIARNLGVTLVVTTATDPLAAQLHLDSHLGALASAIDHSPTVRVTSHGIEPE